MEMDGKLFQLHSDVFCMFFKHNTDLLVLTTISFFERFAFWRLEDFEGFKGVDDSFVSIVSFTPALAHWPSKVG